MHQADVAINNPPSVAFQSWLAVIEKFLSEGYANTERTDESKDAIHQQQSIELEGYEEATFELDDGPNRVGRIMKLWVQLPLQIYSLIDHIRFLPQNSTETVIKVKSLAIPDPQMLCEMSEDGYVETPPTIKSFHFDYADLYKLFRTLDWYKHRWRCKFEESFHLSLRTSRYWSNIP